MIVDVHTEPIAQEIETDVCILGGGTAGIVLARELGQPERGRLDDAEVPASSEI